jgi:hypothetical protein
MWLEALRVKTAYNGDTENGAEVPYNVSAALTEGEMSGRVKHKLGQALTTLHSGECRHDAIRDHQLALLFCGKQGAAGVKPALAMLHKAFCDVAQATGRPGGREAAKTEFLKMLHSAKVAQLLAQPGYDDWMYNIGEPPDADEHHAGEYTANDAESDGAATTPVFAGRILTRSALHELPDPEPLIDNVLDQGTVGLLYGKWGTGKSFIALDWGASVATARPWQGRRTEQRKVLYVAAEGAYGLKGRTNAWEVGWHTSIGDDDLAILPQPVNLTNTAEVRNLAALIEWGGYGFIVLDTLARCMVGADENSAKDCGEVVDALHQLRQATPDGRGVVLGVHHTGKDGKTFRGSSVFEAGADTVYAVKADCGQISLEREKRKDGPESDYHELMLEPLEGTGSCVVNVSRGVRQIDRADQLLSHFLSHFGDTGATPTQLIETCDMSKPTIYRALADLRERGDLINTGTDKRPFYKRSAK